MSPDLVPLKIPTAWIVQLNDFRDVDPIIENGVFKNPEYFHEDLLWIQRFSEQKNFIQYNIYLGWFPDESADGQYQLELEDENHKELHFYRSKSKSEIMEKINHWLYLLGNNPFSFDEEVLKKL